MCDVQQLCSGYVMSSCMMLTEHFSETIYISQRVLIANITKAKNTVKNMTRFL